MKKTIRSIRRVLLALTTTYSGSIVLLRTLLTLRNDDFYHF